MRRAVLVGVAAALVAGCGERDAAAPAPARSAPAPSANVASAAPSTAAPARPEAPKGMAVLDAGGLMIGPTKARARYYAFGTPRAVVDTVAAKVYGIAGERSANAECGAGPMEFTRFASITLNYRDGKLAGWLIDEGPLGVTTDGVRPGSMLRDLKVTRSVREIAGSTLSGEFEYLAADGSPIGGFVAGAGREARIVKLFAGVNCFFR